MADSSLFAAMLMGGHPNSLGRTVEVVEIVLADRRQFEQLYQCYFDGDEVVRLRASNAMKRIWRQEPDWIVPYLDRFLNEIAQIDQPSTRWTLAQLFRELDSRLTNGQRQQAINILKRNLDESNDWIVIGQTLQTLAMWAKRDNELHDWFSEQLMRFMSDPRKSVSGKAQKLFNMLYS